MNSKIVVILFLSLGLFASRTSLGVSGPDRSRTDRVQAELSGIDNNIADEKVTRIEIYYSHIDSDPSILVTKEHLELTAFYKLSIKLRGTIYDKSFADALKSTAVTGLDTQPSLKWAVVLYDWKDQRLGAVYFDKTGEMGMVNNTPASFTQGSGVFGLKTKPALFKWLNDNFSAVFR